MTSLDWATAAARLSLYVALVFLFGIAVFRMVFAPGILGVAIAGRFRGWISLAAVAILMSVLVALPLLSATIVDDWAGAVDTSTLSALLTTPDIGLAWLARLALAVLLLAWLLFFPARMGGPALITVLLLACLALTGHAAMQEGALGWLHTANHVVHVVSASLWLGSLVPLLACLKALRSQALRAEAVDALKRFSLFGHVAVACVIFTGIVNAWLILGRWPLDWASPYQALLAAKIALVLLMVATALVNRYVFTPRLGQDEERALACIARGTLAEIGLGACVLALVAVFGLLEPI